MANKTKTRILDVARLLFNEEGESNVAMVDIAAVLDISPGNLYYHYRGKEQLMPVLFELFEAEFKELLTAPLENLETVDDLWAYCYLLLDVLYQNRFIHSLDLIRFDKQLSRRFSRLRALLEKQIMALFFQLSPSLPPGEGARVAMNPEQDVCQERDLIAENISMFMFAWIGHASLEMDQAASARYLNEGVYRMFFQFAMCMEQRQEFLAQCKLLRSDGIGMPA